MKKYLILMLLASLLFADISPPSAPDVIVTITKNNKLYTENIELEYDCNIHGDNASAYKIDLGFKCNEGVCKNYGWTYMFIRCPNSEGYFRYSLDDGKTSTEISEPIGFNDSGTYNIALDLDEGIQSVEYNQACLPLFLIFGFMATVFAKKKLET